MTTENIKQIMGEEIERIPHRDYTGSLYPRATSSLQSNHRVVTMQPITDYKEVTLNPTKATHPLCIQQIPQARITLTLQDFTAVIQRVI